MLIKIKYFGLLTEVTNCQEETIDFSGNIISELLELLFVKYPNLKNKEFQVAQNQELVPVEAKLLSNEIVLLPPFSGG
ncbi:MoaD/ThiS family protein [Yeosuana marina]|uniref:MoaD/ThiS family protein n=1 Tax=Yeosuana marina TaxID=1565536 RepID=UPI0014247020|nr:MoaD/ThiS family protein [Yeosuana marina]|tara:strand:+ start:536 stop:769 length:234 start_codon:yes stop_codon:yes gene_type:complete